MAVLTLALLEYGCSDDNDFVVVRGEVSYQGAPIEDGDIKFVHTPGTQTPARSAMIKQGKYEASGRGGAGGRHLPHRNQGLYEGVTATGRRSIPL